MKQGKAAMLIAALLFFSLAAISQNREKADSILLLLEEEFSSKKSRLALINGLIPNLSNPDSIVMYADELLGLSIDQDEKYFQSYALLHRGIGNRFRGSLDLSLRSLFEAAQISEKNQFWEILSTTYLEIASTYTQNKDPNNSLLYKSKAIDILRKTEGRQLLAISLLNTGFTYYSIDNLDTALSYYNEAEPIFEEIGLEIGKAYTIGNRALVFWKQGDLETAKSDLLKAINMLEPLGDQYGMADYYNQLGNIYLEQNQNKQAIKYTAIGLEMAIAEGLKEQVRDASLLLSKLYKEQGDFEKSLYYQEEYIAYKDSIQDQETTKQLADFRTEFEVGQKQVEVDLLSVQKRNQQLVSVGLAAILLLTGIFAFITLKNYREKNRINQLLESQAVQLTDQKEELERLNDTKDKFFSIISHDLRGPVNSFMGVSKLIRYFVESKDTDQLIEIADEMETSVGRLSSLLDNLLNWAMQQQGHFPNVPEKINSTELVDGVLGTFENMASGKRIELKSTIAENIDIWADSNMTQTVIRNLVNNALKFTPEGGSVHVTVQAAESMVEIVISDTGVGIASDKLDKLFGLYAKKSTYGTTGEKGLGLGLQLVHEFLETNKGTIRVESEEGKGSTFIIQFPRFDEQSVAV